MMLAHPSVAQRRITDPWSWITTRDYPPELVAAGTTGITNVRFDISEGGRVENCREEYVDVDQLGDLTCRLLMERARYEPAYDRQGSPFRSRGTFGISWEIENGAPAIVYAADYGDAVPRNSPRGWYGPGDLPVRDLPSGSGSLVMRFDISTEGRMTGCSVERPSPSAAVNRQACRVLERRARFHPPIGRDGLPRATAGFVVLRFWAE